MGESPTFSPEAAISILLEWCADQCDPHQAVLAIVYLKSWCQSPRDADLINHNILFESIAYLSTGGSSRTSSDNYLNPEYTIDQIYSKVRDGDILTNSFMMQPSEIYYQYETSAISTILELIDFFLTIDRYNRRQTRVSNGLHIKPSLAMARYYAENRSNAVNIYKKTAFRGIWRNYHPSGHFLYSAKLNSLEIFSRSPATLNYGQILDQEILDKGRLTRFIQSARWIYESMTRIVDPRAFSIEFKSRIPDSVVAVAIQENTTNREMIRIAKNYTSYVKSKSTS